MIPGPLPVPCVSSLVQLGAQNCDHLPPPTHTFLKRRFPTDFEKHTHTPPKVTTFWCITPKVEKSLKKCENAPCWHEPDVPERYIYIYIYIYMCVYIYICKVLARRAPDTIVLCQISQLGPQFDCPLEKPPGRPEQMSKFAQSVPSNTHVTPLLLSPVHISLTTCTLSLGCTMQQRQQGINTNSTYKRVISNA